MSYRAGIRSPNQTSMSQLVGASLVTRPLIGSQIIKKIEEKNSKNPKQRNNSKIANMSTDCLHNKNQLIHHLEIENIEKRNDNTVELPDEDKHKTMLQPDSMNSADKVGAHTMTLTPKEVASS